MNIKTIYTSAVFFLALLFTTCDIAGLKDGPGSREKAAVQVIIGSSGLQSRTVTPDVDLEEANWQLLGRKSGVTEFSLLAELSNGNGTVYLETGTWGFTLEGYKDSVLVLRGNLAEQTISLDSPNILEFTVAPVLSGEGTVSITIELPADSGITEARIFQDSTELTTSVTPVDNRIVLEYPAQPAGDYYFSVRLYKDSDLYGVVSEVVQVRANLYSAMTHTLTWEDLNLLYVITYHLWEGEILPFGYFKHTDDAVTLPADPFRAGYVFRGWYDNAYFDGEPVTSIPMGSRGDRDFYARWLAQYTVTFDAQGGSVDPSSITVTAGEYVTDLPTPTNVINLSGIAYEFDGWFTQPNGGGSRFTTNTPVSGVITVYAKWNITSTTLTEDSGVYIGIISFAATATDLTNGSPIFLDYSGKNSLTSKINSGYAISSQDGTALFYGVHKALANLESITTYPDNLDSVNVITFTDGLDNGSSGESKDNPLENRKFDSGPEYATYVDEQIDSRKIGVGEKPITAYSVGVRGSDVTNIDLFKSNLKKIASDGKDYELTDFSQVQEIFKTIADDLETEDTITNFKMNTARVDSGTWVRLTFETDEAPNAEENSSRFIQGIITDMTDTETDTNVYILSEITYGEGLSSTQGAGPITGTRNSSGGVTFEFTDMKGFDPDYDGAYDPDEKPLHAKQWLGSTDTTTDTINWGVNREYKIKGASDPYVVKRSALIYLVLDASASLNTDQIEEIRVAVNGFINSLYDRLYPDQ
jgi:uncharacterized repeat protein (TIGR02543 family)